MPRLPLIGDLTKGSLPPGSNILVEFDPASQWYNTSLTIAAGWLRGGGNVSYYVYTRSPDSIRSRLGGLGLRVEQLEEEGRLGIHDWYTATLGQKSKEENAVDSLKVADLSIGFANVIFRGEGGPVAPGFLVIEENFSVPDRFNEERNWV